MIKVLRRNMLWYSTCPLTQFSWYLLELQFKKCLYLCVDPIQRDTEAFKGREYLIFGSLPSTEMSRLIHCDLPMLDFWGRYQFWGFKVEKLTWTVLYLIGKPFKNERQNNKMAVSGVTQKIVIRGHLATLNDIEWSRTILFFSTWFMRYSVWN